MRRKEGKELMEAKYKGEQREETWLSIKKGIRKDKRDRKERKCNNGETQLKKRKDFEKGNTSERLKKTNSKQRWKLIRKYIKKWER